MMLLQENVTVLCILSVHILDVFSVFLWYTMFYHMFCHAFSISCALSSSCCNPRQFLYQIFIRKEYLIIVTGHYLERLNLPECFSTFWGFISDNPRIKSDP